MRQHTGQSGAEQRRDATGKSAGAGLILRGIDALPTLSSVASRLLALGADNRAGAHDIAKLIESDPALTARVLTLCNTAGSGIGYRVTTVQRATVVLGADAVRAVALSVQVADWARKLPMNKSPDDDGPSATAGREWRESLWLHSIATACAAEALCRADRRLARRVPPEDAYVAGLLQGLGRIALSVVVPRAYREVIAAWDRRSPDGCADAAAMEHEHLGIDFRAAGRHLVHKWHLPRQVSDAVVLAGLEGEAVSACEHPDLINTVTLGLSLVHRLRLGWSGGSGAHADPAALAAGLGLDAAKLLTVESSLHGIVAERAGVLGLGKHEPGEILVRSIHDANDRLGRIALEAAQLRKQHARAADALEAVEWFLKASADALSVIEVGAAVVKSARRLAGVPAAAVESGWIVWRTGGAGHEAARLSGDGVVASTWAGAPADAAVLVETLGGDDDPWGAVYVCAADGSPKQPDSDLGVPEAVAAAWRSALAAALGRARETRLSEHLARTAHELVASRRRLAHAESMERLAQLTAGAAHELNTPLAVISARAQSLADRLTDDRGKSEAGAIIAAAGRLAALVTRLHRVASPGEPAPEPVDLGEFLRRHGAAWAKLAADDGIVPPVEVRVDGVAEAGLSPPVFAWVDPAMLADAMGEIVGNAAQADSREGIVCSVQTARADRRNVVIEVTDRGRGMSEQAIRHAFDPFFSEKPAGRRQGLGLPLARRLVEAMGGRLSLTSRPGDGTTARLELPAHQANIRAIPAQAA